MAASSVYAQNPEPPTPNTADNADKTILMRDEFSGGLVLHSEGFGITLRRAKQKTYKKKKYVEFDFVSMKDVKEISQQNPYYDNSTSFIYGKLNDFYVPRIGVGRQLVIFAKAHTTGVEVRYNYGFGADLGFTKPIYLNIIYGNPPDQYAKIERYDPSNPNHTADNIFGNAPFTYGLGQMSIYPGGYIKSAVSFEWAKYPDEIWSVETGVVVDVFAQEIPIMAYIPNKQVFFNFYVSISYGGRW
jgi:hypothetical protein